MHMLPKKQRKAKKNASVIMFTEAFKNGAEYKYNAPRLTASMPPGRAAMLT